MAFDKTQNSYISLRNIVSERTDSIVFWAGSGLSEEAGLPTWNTLKRKLLQALDEQIESSERTKLKAKKKAIIAEANNWFAFSMLKSTLGLTTWRAQIREILRPSATTDSPSTYKKIWALSPHGILTLNLDRLATKAYTEVKGQPVLTEFVGTQVANYTHVLKSPHPFICYLHGDLDDASSWVLTSSDLSEQRDDAGYQNFIKCCLTAKTLVFIGISVDDVAIGGFVEQLSSLGVDIEAHYWVTHRRDLETHTWAEDRGIRLIRYNAVDGDHSPLLEMLDDLRSFVPIDDSRDAGPVAPMDVNFNRASMPSKDELLTWDAECIRKTLNQEARRILTDGATDSVEKYDRFIRANDEAIYRAWYTNPNLDNNQLLGYFLNREVASGAFGRVYHATDEGGVNVAVKVLHEEIRRNPELLQAFRRGVRSMKILGEHKVEGMVPYRKAFEIPAFVVMDWVHGPDLGLAVSSKQLRDWELILRVGTNMADVIRRGHVLPERVLHRDIRPSNVMLRGFHSDANKWDVVVLDFDLSWHRGALDRSVVHGSTLLGYLAPEQIQNIPGVSTRHAAVDSFGLGMVLFFMVSERDPIPDEHMHTNWNNTLLQTASKHPCIRWHSTPRRYARLIHSATQNSQSDRWDMTQIQAELQRLYSSVCDPSSTQSAELIAEEVAARCDFTKHYEWDNNKLAAVKDSPSGIKVELRGDESLRMVLASLSWGDPGVTGKAHLAKWIEPRMATVRDILGSSGWEIETAHSRYAHISISARLSVEVASSEMDKAVHSLNRALEQLRF